MSKLRDNKKTAGHLLFGLIIFSMVTEGSLQFTHSGNIFGLEPQAEIYLAIALCSTAVLALMIKKAVTGNVFCFTSEAGEIADTLYALKGS